MSKLPAYMFYTGDWLKDPGLRSVSYGARGLWIDMLSLMHESDRRGYLQVNGKPVFPEQLARMTGGSTDEVSRYLQELESAGVFSRTDDGMIFNRRMVRDEHKRALCSVAGKNGGGNPTYKGVPKGSPKGDIKGIPKGTLEYESEVEIVVPKDSDTWIKKVAKSHPRFEKPVPTMQAIVEQLERLSPRMGAPQAMQYLLDRTELYRKCVDAWPREERRFAVGSMVWFRDACFEEDERQWKRDERPPTGGGNSNGNPTKNEQRAEQAKRNLEAAFGSGNGAASESHPGAVLERHPDHSTAPHARERLDEPPI